MTIAINPAKVRTTDMKLEVIVIPVSDVERSKQFYGRLGWRLDADFTFDGGVRVIQFTPPGSSKGLYLVVSDIEEARKELLRRGVKVSEAFHGGDVNAGPDEPHLFGSVRVSGPDPERRSYFTLASFSDPDGNGWLLQEVTTRLPARVDADTTFTSVGELSSTLRRAAAAHGEHEKRAGKHD